MAQPQKSSDPYEINAELLNVYQPLGFIPFESNELRITYKQ